MVRLLRSLLGLTLVGYGLLVLLRVIAHEALLAGAVSLGIGALLLLPGMPAIQVRRASLVALLGLGALVGVVGYNLFVGSGFSGPEWGLLLYGAALIAASKYLDADIGRFKVGTLVGWSFPLLFAPLFLFALNAVLTGPSGLEAERFADPIIGALFVAPMAFGLNLFGTPATVFANNIIIETSRGSLVLGVGLVCAGLYPMVLFLGVLGLHAWQTGLPRKLLGIYLGIGLVGLYLTNLLRLLILAKVGEMWGGAMLQSVHAHIGWILFALFMVVFWVVVVRRFEGRKDDPDPAGLAAAAQATDPTRPRPAKTATASATRAGQIAPLPRPVRPPSGPAPTGPTPRRSSGPGWVATEKVASRVVPRG